ncbi:pre-rRNA-processing protein-like protein ipi1 [Calycina marina]|uniref:Pre-rRNA-processing protein n=1 Tax=Calycina marina TaxID=1763456 RepID=A0A9P8CIQ4_9HELO|nr:pre-rRNA-processing protein-like protein ipi1 [Calycina marina]
MGSSMKKKRDKKKDFQKPKLRLGKAKAKADNFTDTSFKAKAIIVNQQSLSTSAPSSALQFSHFLSLASSSKSETQRRDALAYLTSQISTKPVNEPLPIPATVILPKLLSLLLDGSTSVRTNLLKLLALLPSGDISAHAETALLYIRAGMTHLAADIRRDALLALEWLLTSTSSNTNDPVVSCPGGWVKTLNCFMTMLGWAASKEPTSWTSASKASFDKTGKMFPQQLTVLAHFIRAGLEEDQTGSIHYSGFGFFQLENRHMMMPSVPNAFAHLNLFGRCRDEEGEMYVDREDRQRVFHRVFMDAVEKGIERAKKEAGEAGRAGAVLQKVLHDGMADFDGSD